jgi:ABC-type amino acid transport substrate-binding protein
MAAWTIGMIVATRLALAQGTPSAAALDRIRDAGRITLGYRSDARPFSFRDASGAPAGYSIALCERIADAIKRELQQPALRVEWVPVAAPDRFRAVQQGAVDVLCGADTVTLERRSEVAFSIPIFPGGIGALLRADAPARLRGVLAGHAQPAHPVWRASATQALQARAFSSVSGTTAEAWLTRRIGELQVLTTVTPSASYDAGVQAVLDRRVDALFGERAVLLDAAQRDPSRTLLVVDRLFTYEPLALAIGRGDEAFHLLVDRTLSQFYASGQLGALYTRWFGEPDDSALSFFRWTALSE